MGQATITLLEAKARAKRWRENTLKGTDFKASLISQADLTGLMAEIGETSIRAYNGIDSAGDYKLMIVAVDENGNDLIDDSKGQYIYDFTMPCPKICDINSPLYS
jgi:hypothetical protein